MQVSVTKREAEVAMETNDYDDRAQNYRRLKWIRHGLDPDEMESKWKKEKELKKKNHVQMRKEANAKRTVEKAQKASAATTFPDERFQQIDSERFSRKKKNIAATTTDDRKASPLLKTNRLKSPAALAKKKKVIVKK